MRALIDVKEISTSTDVKGDSRIIQYYPNTNRFSCPYRENQSQSFQVQLDAKRRAVRRKRGLRISRNGHENRLVSALLTNLDCLIPAISIDHYQFFILKIIFNLIKDLRNPLIF